MLPRLPQFGVLLWLICLGFGAGAGRGWAQQVAEGRWESQYTLREWHAADGLPSEDVTRVHLDRSGYLWLATYRGLARFDGAYFEDIGPELQRAGAASSIRSFAETAELGLVMAPTSGGTLAYRGGQFHRLGFAADKIVNALFAEPNGTLWASCDDQSLLRWAGGKSEEFRPDENGRHRLVAHFATDQAGRIWIAGGTMFGRYESGQLHAIKSEFDGPEFRVGNSRNGGPWIMTVDRLLKMEDGGPREVLKNVPALVGAHYVSALHEDRNGTLWIGTRSQGLYAVVDGRLRAVPLSGEAIMGICEDSEGDIWIATNGGGLSRLRFRDFKIYDRSAGLGDNYSFTVSEDAEGAMWFGNRDGGAARLKDGKIDSFTSWPGQPQIGVTSVLPDGAGRIWITTGAGVFKLNPNVGDATERIAAIPAKPGIAVAHVARNGDYWVGFGGDRVGRYRDGRFDTFGAAEGYEGKQALAITEDAQGGILFGTGDGRLIRFDGRKFTRIPLDVRDDSAAPIQDVYCEPATGFTWIATAGNGVYVLGGGRLRQIRPVDGLIDGAITAILADDQGYLWFGSSVGIFSVRRRDLTDFLEGRISRVLPVAVGRDDGLHGLTCLGIYKPSAWKSRDGKMWFATRKGVLNFDPAKVIADTPSPPAFVAAVRCDDVRRPYRAGDALEISSQVRKLEFRFSALCLSTPDRVRIKYRLDGFDSEWNTAGPDRIVTYPRLPPGSYRLHTMSSFGNGVWSETQSVLAITVQPRWWQTVWFQFVVVMALVAVVVLVVRSVSHRRLRLRLERLERESAIERERTRIARNIHDDLGASLTRISLLTQTAKRDAPTPESRQLGQIYETVRQITRSMDEIVWAVNPKNDHLDGLASYLVSYAQSFLSVASIRCRLDLPDHLPAAHLTSQTRHNLYLCLKEALNNIVKHSGASEVTIQMRTVANSFTLTVSDNGRSNAGNGRHGNGNGNGHGAHEVLRIVSGQGLTNIAQRVAEMGGTYEFLPPGAGWGAKLSITISLGPVGAAKNGAPSRLSVKIIP